MTQNERRGQASMKLIVGTVSVITGSPEELVHVRTHVYTRPNMKP